MQIEIAKIVHRYAHLSRAKKQKLLGKIHSHTLKLVECLHSIDTELGDSEPAKFHRRIDAHVFDLIAYLRVLDVVPKYKHPSLTQSESTKNFFAQQ